MPGTWCSYQRFPARDVRFVRSRGWQADVTVVEVLAEAFPDNFDFNPPDVNVLARRAPPEEVSVGAIRADEPQAGGPLPRAFAPEGTLVMAEEVDGHDWVVVVANLILVRVESVKIADKDRAVAFVRLHLVDERYFWPRGVMRRWSFNRRRPDGTAAFDSRKPNGDPWTRREVAVEAAASMFRAPRLVETPEAWSEDTSGVEFGRFASAMRSLAELASKARLEDPVLRLDGNVALYRAGQGLVGYAPHGRGPNKDPFPADGVRLSKDGTGEGHVVEFSHPEPFVIVVGGERIADVAIDSWEPCLVLAHGREVVPLNEETMARLTDGRYDLAWLKRFVLQPLAYQQQADLDEALLEVFRHQPWRLFRLPGVEVEDLLTGGDAEDQEQIEQNTDLDDGLLPRIPLAQQDEDRREDQERAGAAPPAPRTIPGPNAHLLPLRDRAARVHNRRLPLLVETYRWTSVHVALQGTTAAGQNLAAITNAISQLRATAPRRPVVVRMRWDRRRPLSVQDVFRGNERVPFELGVSLDELQGFVDRAREADSYRTSPDSRGNAFADRLHELTRRQLEIEVDAGAEPGRPEMYDLAREILRLEQELEKATSVVNPRAPVHVQEELERDNGARREAFLERTRDTLNRIASAREERRNRTRLRLNPDAEPVTRTVLRNLPREEDTGARVYDAALGVIRTSELAGHVEVDPDAGVDQPIPTNVSHARFVPRPVRVTFGCVVRPRLDRPSTPVVRVRTGPLHRLNPVPPGTDAEFAEPDVIPEVLGDEETYYTAAFVRQPDRIERVNLADVPRDQAVRIVAEELVELVDVGGGSNGAQLDAQALALAEARLTGAPDMVRATQHVLARPWPVQCDGIVERVEIAMRHEAGVPCGFETVVTCGSGSMQIRHYPGQTRERPRPAVRPAPSRGDGSSREGTRG
jgi:hypothetical protein